MHPVCAVVLALAAVPAVADAVMQSALAPAGPQAAHIDRLWWIMLAVCSIAFAGVVIALAIALWRAPRANAATPPDMRASHAAEPGPRRAVTAAVALTITALLGLLAATLLTDRALARLPLHDALNIEVTGHQWWWEVQYDDADPSRIFVTANEVHIPVGRAVILRLRSQDVIHSFWVPNLHGKTDLIPGQTNLMRLRADRPGTYRGQCAEFCGYQHAHMALTVVAEPAERYEQWAAGQRQPASPPQDASARRGQALFLAGTCPMCHAVLGTQANGQQAPDLTHVASRSTLAAGTLPNTPGHLAAWIADPQRIKPGVNMPPHPLSGEELLALADWLASLR